MKSRATRNIKLPDKDSLVKGIEKGETAALARAITMVESTRPEQAELGREIVESCLKKQPKTIRVGITGVPGVGKSTFIEVLGKTITSLGHRVAVLAVDPTSSISKGSILGDKTRMENLSRDPNAFIRPSPSGESLGGVSRKTREAVILCEAAGYDVILIETVGVGQSEIAVHSMVDFFLLLKLAGAGDELQGIKRGIMEMADAVVINKADGTNLKAANRAKAEFSRALQLYPPKSNGWVPETLTCSSLNNQGITAIWELIRKFESHTRANNSFDNNRKEQNTFWFHQTVEQLLLDAFYATPQLNELSKKLTRRVANLEISPFSAAEVLMEHYREQLK